MLAPVLLAMKAAVLLPQTAWQNSMLHSAIGSPPMPVDRGPAIPSYFPCYYSGFGSSSWRRFCAVLW